MIEVFNIIIRIYYVDMVVGSISKSLKILYVKYFRFYDLLKSVLFVDCIILPNF